MPLYLQTALMKPITRWQQIRDAVAGLESEIWHFRTRTGKYEHQASGTALVNSLPVLA